MTMTLTEFLLARIAEDEEEARQAFAYRGSGTMYPKGHACDPGRVLADCEARRRIVEKVEANTGVTVEDDWPLNFLALPYADHPDYRQEWKP